MFQNKQFNIKKVNKWNLTFYYLISILFVKSCYGTTYDNVYLSDFDDKKLVSIDREEIIRRRNVAETYLKGSINVEKDWIETYHNNFPGSSVFNAKKIQDSSLDSDNGIHASFFMQNEDTKKTLLENVDDSVYRHYSLFSGKKYDKNPKYKTISSVKESGVSGHSLSHDTTSNSCVPKETSESNKVDSKQSGNARTKLKSKLGNQKYFPIDCEMPKNYKSDRDIEYFNNVENDLRLSDYKNLTFNKNKMIQIIIKKAKYTSEKYFINGETLTLTEFNKLQKYLASLSVLQKSKNNVYSVNRMKLIDSIGKVIPKIKQELKEDKFKQLRKSSTRDYDITTGNCNNRGSIANFQKDAEYKKGTTQKKTKDLSVHAINNEKCTLSSNLEKTNRKYFSRDSEMFRRKKLVDSFINALGNNQERWIETYHLNDFKSDPNSKNNYYLQGKVEEDYSFSKLHSKERLYIIRWINKLHNKVKTSQNGYQGFSILVSDDLFKTLEELAQKFDIVTFDELVNNAISNATFHNYANTFCFDYSNIFNVRWILSFKGMFVFTTLLLGFILYNLLFKTKQNNNFGLLRVILDFSAHCKWFLVIIVSIFTFFWHGYRMYQQKIAEKHSVMSSIAPSYCESILVKESGVIAHFKEYFRHWWHNEECKKYYEAVMVDPSSEITFLSIITDLLSETIFQILRPLARNLNSFFKALTYDLSYIQQLYIIVISIFVLIIYMNYGLSFFFAFFRNYKINFPFHLGSVEPTAFCKGSGVEEVEIKETFLEGCTNSNTSVVNYHKKTDVRDYTEEIIVKRSTFGEEIIVKRSTFGKEPMELKLSPLKPALKVSRTRHNSI